MDERNILKADNDNASDPAIVSITSRLWLSSDRSRRQAKQLRGIFDCGNGNTDPRVSRGAVFP